MEVAANPNQPPIAVNDSYTTPEDTSLSIPAPGVLGNDSDSNPGDTLTAVVVTGPAHAQAGSFNLASNGSFSYAPVANYNGADSFTYKVFDGTVYSNIATAAINVTAVNDAPVNTVLPVITGVLKSGETLNVSQGTWTDPEVNTLTYTYQWKRGNDAAGAGAVNIATGQSYVLTSADVDKYIAVVVTATDNGTPPASAQASSLWVGPVEVAANPNKQVVYLKAGWNYFAPTVQATNGMRVQDLLAPAVAANKVIIANNTSGKVYWPAQNVNTMTEPLSPAKGVKVKMATDYTLEINGEPIQGSGDISLTLGTHYIGFLADKNAQTTVQALIDNNALTVVYDGSNGHYIGKQGNAWTNTIVNFEKGKAYMVVVTKPGVINIKN